MKNCQSFFQNRACECFPCHALPEENFNCLFCFCPLYTLGSKCGGRFAYLENGVKDCSACPIPHTPGGYDYILSKFPEISALAEKNREN